MASARTLKAGVTGALSFHPDEFFEAWATQVVSPPSFPENNLRNSVIRAFGLRDNDDYVYHAVASVTLHQVQTAVNHGKQHGLQAWYWDAEGKQIDAPALADIEAYIAIFASSTSTSKALTAFEKNAKKGSLREKIAAHLMSSRTFPNNLVIPKLKKPQINPYLDFWNWSCKALNWAGPEESTVNIKHSHHVLPIFYHHFGCVCPSFEALESIKQISNGMSIVELGSGNGYWSYLLRRLGLTVHAIDNGDSVWRTTWISDTIKMDAAKYLKREHGCRNSTLLLVYPQVTTEFTTAVLGAYTGDVICIAGTQNANGFTAFKDTSVEAYLAGHRKEFEKIVQTPLPSFPGKDEAFFVFRRKRA